jgi:hypothetical protein
MMLALALVFDGLQALVTLVPVLGQALSIMLTIIAVTSFGLWFAIKGVSYFSGRKAGLKIAATLGSTVAELIPFIQALPAISLSVLVVIMASRLEDKEENAEEKRTAPAPMRIMPRVVRLPANPPPAVNDNPNGPLRAEENDETYSQAA